MSLWLIFLTGLTTGGVSCAALQSGLLLSSISSAQKETQKTWLPVALFLAFKLLIYTFLGLLLGLFGSVFNLSLTFRLILQSIAVAYMLVTAFNLLELHPFFRHFVIVPPKWIFRRIKVLSSHQDLFTPALLGSLTVLIPCGVTQAMELVAVITGKPLSGALIMMSFVLGTIPLFTLIGLAATRGNSTSKLWFTKLSAGLLILMSLITINGILTVMDAPLNVSKLVNLYTTVRRYETGPVLGQSVTNGSQSVSIKITQHGYEPNHLTVQHGSPVTLTVSSDGVYSCALAFSLKAFNIYEQLQPTDSKTFTFTPIMPGQYTYSCSMGMYTGVLEVL